MSGGCGQAPARQAAIAAGLPSTIPCSTINKVCASGMKATEMAANMIMLGRRDVVVCGGMESMSNVPYYSSNMRDGARLGHVQLTDGLVLDGLTDPGSSSHMGVCAETCADDHSVSREEQDAYAAMSYRRAIAATSADKLSMEIAPVEVPTRRGKPSVVVDRDEEPNKREVTIDSLSSMRTVFKRDGGTVTAGNSSTLSDGAAALVLVSRSYAEQHNLTPLAVIRGMACAAQAPVQFTTSPAVAIPAAVVDAGLDGVADIDYFEVNEAFSVVAVANAKLLGLDEEAVENKVNVYGGAVSLGHPLGCSGARIIVTLISVLHQEGGRFGVAGVCNGGGGASAMVIERINTTQAN